MIRIIVAHLFVDLRMLGRMPAYTVPTLVMPSLFLLLFGAQRGRDGGIPGVILVTSFATFAVFGVVFYKFGVSTAIERVAPWARYMRALPVPPGSVLAARSLSAVVFALAAASAVFITARTALGIGLPVVHLLRVYAGLLGGAVPFTLLGMAVGYRTVPRSAVAVSNLVYLVLSYAGGLWVPRSALPEMLQAVAPLLPTYHWGQVVWSSALGRPWAVLDWLVLAAWTAAFGAAAAHGYLRDEGSRYA
jgi:ABC-2 type transport system permease protein